MKVSTNFNMDEESKAQYYQRNEKKKNEKTKCSGMIRKKKSKSKVNKIQAKKENQKSSKLVLSDFSLEKDVDANSSLNCRKHKEDNLYKPGMITELIQQRKFGNVILPWDPSFGLDPSYKPPEWDGIGPKPVVNPLFDLSKRIDGTNNATIDVADRTLFVGNLESETKIGDLKKLFRKCGKMIKVKLRKSSPKSSSLESNNQTNAIIRFETIEGCSAALKMNGKLYKGHRLRVTFQQDCSKTDTKRSIFVGNLAFEAGDDDLWNVFESCGDIESVRVVRDKQSGKSRGFGYVNFKSLASVDKAVTLDKTSILGHELRVMRNEDNVRSLSNTITVKRKNKKRRKPISNNKHDKRENNLSMNIDGVETGNKDSELFIIKKFQQKNNKKRSLQTT